MTPSSGAVTLPPTLPHRPGRSLPRPLILTAAAGCLALFALVLLKPWLAITGLLLVALGVPAVALAWAYPEVGLLALVFLGSRVLDPQLVQVNLPFGGGLELPDLALVALGGTALLRQVRHRNLHLPASWVVPPLLLYLWLAVFSALMAVLLRGVEPSWALAELRGIAYYVTFLLVIWEVKQRGQLKRLLIGLSVIGLFVVGIMLVQQFVGPVPLFSGQDNTSWQIIGASTGGVTRIRPPAHVLLYWLSLLWFVLAMYVRSAPAKIGLLLLAVFMNAALLLTFTRSQWVASVIALGLGFFLMPSQARLALVGLVAALLVIGGALFVTQRDRYEAFISEQNFATPLVMRIESVFELDQTLDSYSARTRYMQTDAALVSIAEHPLDGVGLGNYYRGLTADEATTRYTRFARFIENSYLYIATKLGLPGLLLFVWLSVAVLWGAARSFQLAHDPLLKGISLASLISWTGMMAWAFNHPLLMLPEYTVMVGLIAGVSEAAGLMIRGDRL